MGIFVFSVVSFQIPIDDTDEPHTFFSKKWRLRGDGGEIEISHKETEAEKLPYISILK